MQQRLRASFLSTARGSFFNHFIHKIDNFGNTATEFINYMVLYRIYKMPHVKSRVVARGSARKVPRKTQRNGTQSPVENPRLSQAAVENSHALCLLRSRLRCNW